MDRAAQIEAFLTDNGWGEALRDPVPGDASTRRYERLSLGPQKAVLMDAPKGAETPSEPEGASIADRRALGYNALARLAGPNPESFAAIANELTIRGYSAPDIIAADLDAGLMLLEDLGDDLFARVIEKDPNQERKLYKAAIDTLAAIYRSSFPKDFNYRGTKWRVRDYDEAALQAEADLFLDWFVADLGIDLSKDALAEWYDIWAEMFTHLGAHAPGLALRDFHAENLFWLPDRQATARVGLIDFQDALFTHPAYDLVSLLEDARRDVSFDLREDMERRFCEKAGLAYNAEFTNAYAVMAAQRNAKILGIFVRLAKRDGKPQYRKLLPRVVKYFLMDLKFPATIKLGDWVGRHVPQIHNIHYEIKTAMVMAAGHGTRMRPLTLDKSKAMVVVDGKPLIDHTLDRLAQVGVERAVVNVHAHADHLEAHLKQRTGLPEIIISDERDLLLETGGGVVKALPLLGDGPVFICNIDAVWTENSELKNMMRQWDPCFMDDLLMCAHREESLGYHGKGDFEISYAQDDYTPLVSRRTQDTAPYVYAGVQIAKLDAFKGLDIRPFSRNEIWDHSLSKNRLSLYTMEGFWMHVGDPQALKDAEGKLQQAPGE